MSAFPSLQSLKKGTMELASRSDHAASSVGSSPRVGAAGGGMSPSHRLVSRFVQPYDIVPGASSGEGGGGRRPAGQSAKLTKWTLIALLYAGCIGSGYGFEDAVGAAGPLYALIFCLVVPWIWSLPTGLVVAELSTSIKSNSGVLMWINVTFPPALSFINVVASIFIIFVGNATYPNLAAEYVTKLFPSAPLFLELAVKLIVVLLCAVANIVGIEIVGKTSLVLSIFTALPFVVFSLHQLALNGGLSFAALGHVPSHVNWATFLSIASWNYSNLESCGTVVEDVYNPRVNIPGAMLPLVLSTYVSYLLPTATGVSALGVDQDWGHWRSGYWPTVARTISGPWLQHYLSLGAILTSFGYTVTGICCSSNMLAGLGQMDVFPRSLSQWLSRTHPHFGTPVNSILLNAFVTISFSLSLSFGEVVALSQAIYCLRLALVFVAVVRLRRQHPTLMRPYAIPVRRTSNLALLLAVPFCTSLVIALASAQHSTLVSASVVAFLLITAVAAHFYVKKMRPLGFGGSVQYFYESHATASSASDPSLNFETSAVPAHLLPTSPHGSIIDIDSSAGMDEDDEEDTGDDPNDTNGTAAVIVAGSGSSSGSSSATAASGQRLRQQELDLIIGSTAATSVSVSSLPLPLSGGVSPSAAGDAFLEAGAAGGELLRYRRSGAAAGAKSH